MVLVRFQVLLDYPDFTKPNTVYKKLATTNSYELVSSGLEEPLGPPEAQQQQADPRARIWWNAFAKNGSAEATLVYANYGTIEGEPKVYISPYWCIYFVDFSRL